jgi:hypothetical protein
MIDRLRGFFRFDLDELARHEQIRIVEVPSSWIRFFDDFDLDDWRWIDRFAALLLALKSEKAFSGLLTYPKLNILRL